MAHVFPPFVVVAAAATKSHARAVFLPLFCSSQHSDYLIHSEIFSVGHYELQHNPEISRKIVYFGVGGVSRSGSIAHVASRALHRLSLPEIIQNGCAPAGSGHAELFHAQQLRIC